MSLYIETKYVAYIASRLRNFKKKDANLWNCSCPICLDSKSNKYKARGYIYMKEQKLYYMCHNCGASMGFGKFLEQVDAGLHSEYRVEMYRDKNTTTRKEVKKEEPEEANLDEAFKTNTEKRLKVKPKVVPDSLLDRLMDRLDQLPDDHEAVVYADSRKIPRNQFHKMYFIPKMTDIVQLKDKYKERIKTDEPRIVLPFYDLNGQLSGVTCRGMRGESLRYITIKIKEDTPLIFGINDIDKSKRVYVTEGPLDSMFLPNACAVGGTSMGKLRSLGLPEDKVIIFDNQPRNPEVCDIIKKNIDAGHNVVIWNSRITQKDINDMAIDGVDFMKEIESRVFRGLQAEMEFVKWRKC